MQEKDVVKTLNQFLKGQYMGIHAYEHYIGMLQDRYIKKEFQAIQQNHKQHAQQVAERIQNLGGTPVNDEGVVGSVQGYIGKFLMPKDTKGIVESALKGESHYGVEISEEIVKGDLDKESHRVVKEILDKDRQHVKILEQLSKQHY
ncbi:ferritin-like domain-containing protein [Pontibacillus salicampi]|uniref:Ferritin-like domain-containing protein n=1 Tax=Pontibacillus salicampi TaxID=1449801 RepID=A0ABV6LQG6_9BACI